LRRSRPSVRLPPPDDIIVPEEALVVENGVFKGISKAWVEENYPDGASFSVTVPAEATSISDYAFHYAQYNGPSNTQRMLSGKYSLSSIDFSQAKNLKSIGVGAFAYTNITVADMGATSLETIGGQAFNSCKSLKTVVLPSTLKSIGTSSKGSSFNDCGAIESITTAGKDSEDALVLPDGLEYIANYSFKEALASSVSTHVTVPANVVFLGTEAFRSSSITQLSIEADAAATAYYANSGTIAPNSSALVVFKNKAAYETCKASNKNTCTYPVAVTFPGAGTDGADLVQLKLAGFVLRYELQDDGSWAEDDSYVYPAPTGDAAKPGYSVQWTIGSSNLTSAASKMPKCDDEVTATANVKFSISTNIEYTIDGIVQEDSNLVVVLDGNDHTAGFTVTHPLTLDQYGTEDDYVYFEYAWYDEVAQSSSSSISFPIAGPRVQEEGNQLFSTSLTPEYWTNVSEIPIRSIDDARTGFDQYLMLLRAHHVVDGVDSVYLMTCVNAIGMNTPGANVNLSLVFHVKTKVQLSYDLTADGTVDDSAVFDAGETATIKDIDARDGYRFNGWVDSDGKTYQPGETVVMDAPLTLTAQWEELEHGTIEPVSMTAYVGGVSAAGGAMPKIRYQVATPEGTTLDGLAFTLHTVSEDGTEETTALARTRVDETDPESLCLFPALDSE
jgi:uncharacterized repeat protein (TIGR02543 family)